MSALERELEQLIKHLNDKNKLVAKSFLSWLLENQLDEEDDQLTPEDIRAIEQGRQELMKREAVPLEDLKRDLGL